MISFLRDLVFKDFWLKLFSLALAVLVWLIVSFAIKKEVPPGSKEPEPKTSVATSERTFANLPVLVMSAAQDVRNMRVRPAQVEVTVQGDAETIKRLQSKEIRALVDLTGIESARQLTKRIEVSTPAGISHVRVLPEDVEVIIPRN